jgi:hypothetical protein
MERADSLRQGLRNLIALLEGRILPDLCDCERRRLACCQARLLLTRLESEDLQ